jgi:hypothetical protein
MPLRHTSLTPRSLAARRSNALKSTGPRTARGKARVCLNALKDGGHAVLAARAPRLRQRLLEAGRIEEEAVYGAIRSRIAQASPIQGPAARQQIDRLALLAWCSAWRTRPRKSKLESPVFSAINAFWVSTECGLKPRRFSIRDPWRRMGLVFWRQRRHRPAGNIPPWQAGSTNPAAESSNKRLAAVKPAASPFRLDRNQEARQVYEAAIRCRLYRLAKPGALERDRYRVLPDGNPDPTLKRWTVFKGNEGATWPGSRESWTVPPARGGQQDRL